jgi:hypothetical protein
MPLARAWRRQLFGASAAALLAPGAILAALAVLALGGGIGGLGSFGQLLTGPLIPASSSRSAAAVAAVRAAASAPAPAVPPVLAAPARPRGVLLVATVHYVQPRVRTVPLVPRTVVPAPPTHRVAPVKTVTQTAVAPAPPPATPTQSSGLLGTVLSAGASVAAKLPGPVGSLGTSILNAVSSTLGKLLPPQHGSTLTALVPGK